MLSDLLATSIGTHTVLTGAFAAAQGDLGWIEHAVKTATGPFGFVIIFVYSVLIAVVLPLPSEVVLLAPLDLGLPNWLAVALIILVSGLGKALGSLLALRLGHEAKQAGPVLRALNRTGIDVVGISQRKTVEIAQKYGYIGLALALCVPGFPDTLSIYAFTVIEENYPKFAAAVFTGSVGRLVLWQFGIGFITMFF